MKAIVQQVGDQRNKETQEMERENGRVIVNLLCIASTVTKPHPYSLIHTFDWLYCQQQSALHGPHPPTVSFPPSLPALSLSPSSSPVNESSQTQAVKQYSVSLSLSHRSLCPFSSQEQTVSGASAQQRSHRGLTEERRQKTSLRAFTTPRAFTTTA